MMRIERDDEYVDIRLCYQMQAKKCDNMFRYHTTTDDGNEREIYSEECDKMLLYHVMDDDDEIGGGGDGVDGDDVSDDHDDNLW